MMVLPARPVAVRKLIQHMSRMNQMKVPPQSETQAPAVAIPLGIQEQLTNVWKGKKEVRNVQSLIDRKFV